MKRETLKLKQGAGKSGTFRARHPGGKTNPRNTPRDKPRERRLRNLVQLRGGPKDGAFVRRSSFLFTATFAGDWRGHYEPGGEWIPEGGPNHG